MTTLVLTGRIMCVSAQGEASTVVVRDGVIDAVGGPEVAAGLHGADVRRVDHGSALVVPGFVDPHVHLGHVATGSRYGVDCRVPGIQTIADVLDALRDGLTEGNALGGWLRGYGNLFFDQKLAERRLPTRDELDRVSRTLPIQLQCGGHTSVLNSRALELARVERFLGGAAGGWGAPVVEVDEDGRPTGVVAEIDAMLPVPELSEEEQHAAVRTTYSEELLRFGVTTIGEMAESTAEVEMLDALVSLRELAGRVTAYLIVPSGLPLGEAVRWASGYRSAAGSSRMRVAGLKMFADGGYSSRNAATRTAYVEDHAPHRHYRGRLNLTEAQLHDVLTLVRDADLQLAVHGNGARAQDEVLAAIEHAGNPFGHRRVRIEHAGNILGCIEDLDRWRRTNVIPVLQPHFLRNFVADFVPMLLGDVALHGRLPLRTMLDNGVVPAASSDIALGYEVGQSNPLLSILECLERRSYYDRIVEPQEAITFAEALRLHTIEGARALGIDDLVGSVEPGKRADLVVLDRDPTTDPIRMLRETAVAEVYVDGDLVHSA
ncbi:amidohydrolase [Mycobacterium sp. NAZ190054]|uniref:amidohydrolase n=1 Tax=Mycobacterium sp. NAZ190054 TaxID=1747766 RepID=UPI00079B1B40|nr:amidohydrolase family protein [Mycobacterium sp. NAZ190054]KWX68871.1 hypothetical protein ASJ79_15925 [Mycobacterium sp. NAZ190054]